MHYLSHYYIDRHVSQPAFTAGALIPDLLPHFTKIYNKQIRHLAQPAPTELVMLHAGVLRHFEVDRWFHGSIVFREVSATVSQVLRDSALAAGGYRLWFIAHIAVEMLLDRWLCELQPALCDAYYIQLAALDTKLLTLYAAWLTTTGQDMPVLPNFNRFMEVKYLYRIATLDGAIEGLSRIYERATGLAFTPNHKQIFSSIFDNIESIVRYRADEMITIKPYTSA
jgi:hypothetical protein